MTLANKITIVRIVSIPIIVIVLLQKAGLWPFILFTLSALTDVLDGFVARLREEKSVLGSFLDPVADKLLLVSSYLVLAYLDIVPMWAFVVVFSRDLLILLGWNLVFILTKKPSIENRWLGKVTTFIQMTTVIIILIQPFINVGFIFSIFFWFMIASTAFSTIDYVLVGSRKLNRLGY